MSAVHLGTWRVYTCNTSLCHTPNTQLAACSCHDANNVRRRRDHWHWQWRGWPVQSLKL